jgi:hypothetical protein
MFSRFLPDFPRFNGSFGTCLLLVHLRILKSSTSGELWPDGMFEFENKISPTFEFPVVPTWRLLTHSTAGSSGTDRHERHVKPKTRGKLKPKATMANLHIEQRLHKHSAVFKKVFYVFTIRPPHALCTGARNRRRGSCETYKKT